MKDIATVWDDLTDKNRAELLEVLAGKRQGQVVSATISNWEAAENAIKTMENSAGSAMREMNTYTESLAYSINAFKESWTEIGQTAIDRGDIKAIVDVGTTALNIVNEIVDTLGAIPTILATIAGITAIKNVGSPKMFGLALICQQ